jgi:hypothetical protein
METKKIDCEVIRMSQLTLNIEPTNGRGEEADKTLLVEVYNSLHLMYQGICSYLEQIYIH